MWIVTTSGMLVNAEHIEVNFYEPEADETRGVINDDWLFLSEGDKTREIYGWLSRNKRCLNLGV